MPVESGQQSSRHSNKAPSALIFDSGVGAISIAREIRRQMPGLTLHFGIDNGFYPYGTKPEDTLGPRIVDIASRMVAACDADLLVVGCNTASTLALPELRQTLRQPVVGVVPAIKPAAAGSRTGTIALIATEGTVNRRYTRELIDQFANSSRVINVPAPELVALAEAKLRGETIAAADLAPVIERLFSGPHGETLDTAVLACTHFPLLRDELSAASPRPLTWLDSGDAIARRVRWWLDELNLTLPSEPHSSQLLTSSEHQSEQILQAFGEFGPTYQHQAIAVRL
ncbi:glutamate racemase [Microbulbifer agarilyticus]|uniref:glutamate racemase n=1 Tax=Microbulbifer agarilyticus TaxID=260552 RepID=UPI001C97C398|nr:glutamate racemase [Microbulbifer agarilyticus]MBY6210729.1 glutamate racemase [Microbulbifer agarilyticus]